MRIKKNIQIFQPGPIKPVPLCTFCATPFYVPYCTFCLSFKEKCSLSGAKTQVKYLNPGMFLLRRYSYILLCFITLLQKHIAVVQNSNIQGLFLKVNAISCPTPNPTLNLPHSVNKHKTDIKTYLLKQTCHFDFLICRFQLLCQTLINVTRDSSWSSLPPKKRLRTL